ncbi:MAG: hypothetical protein RIT28_4994, partial [Pseudomonadota bacterium]
MVIPPVAVALVAEPLAWLLLAWPGVLDGAAWYGRSGLLVAVHLITVGTLMMAIVGLGWQLVPVVTAQSPPPGWARLAAVCDALILGGGVGLMLGLGWPQGLGALGGIGAAGLILGLLLRALGVLRALSRAKGRRVTRLWLVLAELSGLAGLTLGALLYSGRAGFWFVLPPVTGIAHHAALLLLGWVGGWMLGLGGLLLPMFSLSAEPR